MSILDLNNPYDGWVCRRVSREQPHGKVLSEGLEKRLRIFEAAFSANGSEKWTSRPTTDEVKGFWSINNERVWVSVYLDPVFEWYECSLWASNEDDFNSYYGSFMRHLSLFDREEVLTEFENRIGNEDSSAFSWLLSGWWNGGPVDFQILEFFREGFKNPDFGYRTEVLASLYFGINYFEALLPSIVSYKKPNENESVEHIHLAEFYFEQNKELLWEYLKNAGRFAQHTSRPDEGYVS